MFWRKPVLKSTVNNAGYGGNEHRISYIIICTTVHAQRSLNQYIYLTTTTPRVEHDAWVTVEREIVLAFYVYFSWNILFILYHGSRSSNRQSCAFFDSATISTIRDRNLSLGTAILRRGRSNFGRARDKLAHDAYQPLGGRVKMSVVS